MLYNRFWRTVSVSGIRIERSTEARQLSNFRVRWGAIDNLTHLYDLKFGKTRKMMVDSGATTKRPMVDLPEKDDDGAHASGGWKSEDGKLLCGYSSFRGKRASMEDFYDIKNSRINENSVCLFGIFDGHGGSRAAEFLKENLFENLLKHSEFITNPKLAISETYKKTDMDFLESEKHSFRDDGSTASAAVLVGNHLYVANVGDSRTIISKAGRAIPLSEDHKPNRTDERKRIESAGGVVMWAGTWRVGGVLAMSRAFGNRMLKQYVVAEPEIQEQEVDQDLELLVLASDGLWDVVPNEDAVSIAQTEEEPEAAARKLTETAFHRGSADNITCIVVKFNHNNPAPEEIQADPKAKPMAVTEPKAEPMAVTEPKAEPMAVTEPKAEPMAVTEPKAEPMAVTEPKAEPMAVTEPKAEPVEAQQNCKSGPEEPKQDPKEEPKETTLQSEKIVQS